MVQWSKINKEVDNGQSDGWGAATWGSSPWGGESGSIWIKIDKVTEDE